MTLTLNFYELFMALLEMFVKLHPKLTHLPPIFASNIDPRNHPTLADSDAGVPRSDRRGFIECNQTVAPV